MTEKDNALRERVEMLMHYEGVSKGEFAEKIGRDASNFSAILAGRRRVPMGLEEQILSAYPNISKEWLLFGEGNMFKDEEVFGQLKTRPRLPTGDVSEHISKYLEGMLRITCDEKPVIDRLPDYDFTIILNHDSMSPIYLKGDEIALKKVSVADLGRDNIIDTRSIEWGHDYLIDTCSHGPKFKRLYEDGDYFVFRSYDQKNFPDYYVRKQDVCAIYRVVGMIRV